MSLYRWIDMPIWILELVPGTWYLLPGTWSLVPATWYLAPPGRFLGGRGQAVETNQWSRMASRAKA